MTSLVGPTTFADTIFQYFPISYPCILSKYIFFVFVIGHKKDYEVLNIPKFNLTVAYINDSSNVSLDAKSPLMEELKGITGNENYRGW